MALRNSVKTILSKSTFNRHSCLQDNTQTRNMFSSMMRCATRGEAAEKRSEIFGKEKQRQIDQIKRVEKIEVEYEGHSENLFFHLNKHISTPFNVAQHISESVIERSALAFVNGTPWDMHRPLENDCRLTFGTFHDADPYQINKAFWRSCSFLLGYACDTVFGENLALQLHSFPPPSVNSGSFVYDIDLGLRDDWRPSKEELMVLSARMHRIAEESHCFERLVVDRDLALDMFADSSHKKKQIPSIAKNSPSGTSVTVYRVNKHVDISSGPMVANTNFLGRRCTITSVHKVERNGQLLYRFQGVALPKGIFLNHAAFHILENRATSINNGTDLSAQKVNLS